MSENFILKLFKLKPGQRIKRKTDGIIFTVINSLGVNTLIDNEFRSVLIATIFPNWVGDFDDIAEVLPPTKEVFLENCIVKHYNKECNCYVLNEEIEKIESVEFHLTGPEFRELFK